MYKLSELTEGDLAVCMMFASLRTVSSRRQGLTRPFDTGSVDQFKNEQNGLIAEYAFCKYHNIFFDGSFAGKDDGYDCILKGNRIDIKSITDQSHNLCAHLNTDKSLVDLYVLIQVEDAMTYIVGWIPKIEFIQPSNIRNIGHGECYFMRRENLRKWGNR